MLLARMHIDIWEVNLSRDTYPESCITKYTSVRRETLVNELKMVLARMDIDIWEVNRIAENPF